MAELRDEACVVARADLADVGQVGTRGEDVLLSRDADGLDLAGGGSRLETVERLTQLRERRRAQRVRTGVVTTVVERDQGQHLARGETDVAHRGLGDDLALGERLDGGEVDLVVVRHGGAHFFFLPS